MPKFEAGNPGKPKGAISKSKLFREKLEEVGLDLIDEIDKLLKSDELHPSQRARILCELMQYEFPKRKDLEISASIENTQANVQILLPSNGRELRLEALESGESAPLTKLPSYTAGLASGDKQ
jgi:hypothetical protein